MAETEIGRIKRHIELANHSIARAKKDMDQAVAELEEASLIQRRGGVFDEMHGHGVPQRKARELQDAISDWLRRWPDDTFKVASALDALARNIGAAEHVVGRCRQAMERGR